MKQPLDNKINKWLRLISWSETKQVGSRNSPAFPPPPIDQLILTLAFQWELKCMIWMISFWLIFYGHFFSLELRTSREIVILMSLIESTRSKPDVVIFPLPLTLIIVVAISVSSRCYLNHFQLQKKTLKAISRKFTLIRGVNFNISMGSSNRIQL